MRSLLIDLDGVLYVGDNAVPGATAAISWLDESGLTYLYVTNTTSRPRTAIVAKLEKLGFSTTEERILTPPVAAARWLEEKHLLRVALFIPQATRAEFSTFDVLEPESESGADAVIIGDLGEAWDFHTLNRAFRLLMQEPQPKLIALGMTRYWRADDGLRLDTGPFVTALSHAAGVEPEVLGKPAPAFFNAALSVLGTPASDTLMIGDDIRTDVLAAQRCNIPGMLVRTGKFREEDLPGEMQPFAVLDSIADLPSWWGRDVDDR